MEKEGEDIEYCGTGLYSVFDGTNLMCESGSCCSIHGKCGQQTYHCEYGLHPYWVIFTGFIQMSIWSFIYQTQVTFPRLIKLMEKYKRTGLRVDAIIVKDNNQPNKKQRCCCRCRCIINRISRLFRCYQEGMRHCRWNRLIIEYNIKTSKGGKNNNKTLLKRGNPRENESYYRVRKTIYVSKYVLKNVIGGGENTDDNNNNDDNGIIRILVLPTKPKSGLPRDEIILTIIKQQNQLKATYVAIFIFTCLYLYLSILVLSLIGGGHKNKLVGWKYFICNFIWTPILPLIVGKIRDTKESKRWLYDDGEYINIHDDQSSNSNNRTSSTTNQQQQQQHKPLLLMLEEEEDVDEESENDDHHDEEKR